MNLTWHIVKKDLCALKWPLLVWLLIIVSQLGVGVTLLSTNGTEDQDWFQRMDTVAKLLGAVKFVSFVLTAALIQQDLLVGTTAFWQTRPISGGRLLRAKLLSIGLVFGFMPVLVTLPWWLGCGYGLREIAWAAAETVAVHAIAVLIGLLWAVVTDGFARFLMWTLVAAFTIPTLTGTLLYYTTRGQSGPSGDLVSTRLMLQAAVAVAGILGVTIHQFLTRNLWRSVAIIGGVATLMIAVGVWWPWATNIESRLNLWLVRQAQGEWPVSAEPAGLKFIVEPSQITPLANGSRPSKVSLVRTKYRVEGLVMSQGLVAASSEYAWRWPDGTEQAGRSWSRSSLMDRAAEQALNLDQKYDRNAPYADSLVVNTSVPAALAAKLQAEPSAYTLQARLRLMRFQAATPVPLQPGPREVQDRLGRRIASVEKSGEQLLVTFISHVPSLLIDNAGGGVLAPFGQFEQYFLVNRATGFVDRGSALNRLTTNIGTVGISWNTMAYRASKAAGGSRAQLEAMNALNEAELVKVTFTDQARFTHELKIDPFTAELGKP